jgi:hypothetical protein
MNRLIAVALILAVACVAFAGGNPDIRAYFDFDPPYYLHAVYPAPYTSVDMYICVDNVDQGITTFSFRMDDPVASNPGVIIACNWTQLLPGGFIPMDPWPFGVTVFSSECVASDPLIVGRVNFFYLGGSCCLEILDHPDYPRWVVDCSEPGEIDYYCVLAHASIGGAVCPEGDCAQVPIESSTWGSVKSLYR